MHYLAVFLSNWRTLAASTFGLAVGSCLTAYMSSLFAPQLIAEFGWTRSQQVLVE